MKSTFFIFAIVVLSTFWQCNPADQIEADQQFAAFLERDLNDYERLVINLEQSGSQQDAIDALDEYESNIKNHLPVYNILFHHHPHMQSVFIDFNQRIESFSKALSERQKKIDTRLTAAWLTINRFNLDGRVSDKYNEVEDLKQILYDRMIRTRYSTLYSLTIE